MKRRTDSVEHRLKWFVEGQGVAVTLLAFFVFVLLCIRYYQKHNFSSQTSPSPAPVVVEVQGDVSRPGIYLLPAETATFWDAVQAAGGLSAGEAEDSQRLLLNRTIATGEMLRVTRGAGGSLDCTVGPMSARARLLLGQKLDINRAGVGELCLVPHMRPEFAQRIVERRQSRPWNDLEELTEVPGIGPKTIEKLKHHLEINARD